MQVLRIGAFTTPLTLTSGRDSGSEDKSLAPEVRLLANTLEDLDDTIKVRHLDYGENAELLERARACKEVLDDLEGICSRGTTLTIEKRQTLLGAGLSEATLDVRDRLTLELALLQSLYDNLVKGRGSGANLEDALARLAQDYNSGRRDPSSVYMLAQHVAAEEDTSWAMLTNDLEAVGISEVSSKEYKSYIREYLEGSVKPPSPLRHRASTSASATLLGSNLSPSTTLVDATSPDRLSRELSMTSIARKPLPSSPSIGSSSLTASPVQGHQLDHRPSQIDLDARLAAELAEEEQRGISRTHSHQEEESTNMIWTAQQIVVYFNRKDWPRAEAHIQQQIKAVLTGEWIEIKGQRTRPDIRILRHLLGCCLSFQGNFVQAKKYFEASFSGPYLNGAHLDDGDVAAARWLGDACLQMNESQNAALAYAIALDGIVARTSIGATQIEPGCRIAHELASVNASLRGLQSLKASFSRFNIDASSILPNTTDAAKSRLVNLAIDLIQRRSPSVASSTRPGVDIHVAEGFLMQPLINRGAWPLPYDPFFQVNQCIQLTLKMDRKRSALLGNGFPGSIDPKLIPSAGYSTSQKKFDYTTKRDVWWLMNSIERGLKAHQVEHKQQHDGFVCRLASTIDNIAYCELIVIIVRKLSMRSAKWGMKVQEAENQTRRLATIGDLGARKQAREEFASFMRVYLEDAEQRTAQGRPLEDPPNIFLPKVPELQDQPRPELDSQQVVPEMAGAPYTAELHGVAMVSQLGTTPTSPVQLHGNSMKMVAQLDSHQVPVELDSTPVQVPVRHSQSIHHAATTNHSPPTLHHSASSPLRPMRQPPPIPRTHPTG